MEVSLGDSCGCVITALGFCPQEVSIGGHHTLSGVDAEKLIGRNYTSGRQRVHDRGRWAQLKVVAFSVGNMILVVRCGMHTNAGERFEAKCLPKDCYARMVYKKSSKTNVVPQHTRVNKGGEFRGREL